MSLPLSLLLKTSDIAGERAVMRSYADIGMCQAVRMAATGSIGPSAARAPHLDDPRAAAGNRQVGSGYGDHQSGEGGWAAASGLGRRGRDARCAVSTAT